MAVDLFLQLVCMSFAGNQWRRPRDGDFGRKQRVFITASAVSYASLCLWELMMSSLIRLLPGLTMMVVRLVLLPGLKRMVVRPHTSWLRYRVISSSKLYRKSASCTSSRTSPHRNAVVRRRSVDAGTSSFRAPPCGPMSTSRRFRCAVAAPIAQTTIHVRRSSATRCTRSASSCTWNT